MQKAFPILLLASLCVFCADLRAEDTQTLGISGAGTNNTAIPMDGLGTSSTITNNSLLEINMRTNADPTRVNSSSQPQGSPRSRIIKVDASAFPVSMAIIPAGTFNMGDNLDKESDAPTANVNVSAFYMDVNVISYEQWQSVYIWATNHGYLFAHSGSGKAPNHPVQTVDWFDAVKWCNARSQQAGRTPVYYTDSAFTRLYTSGETNPRANWSAGGYRLPTEAEWEKAARGGADGLRFPWGNIITESQANYYGATNSFNYDWGPNGYNAFFTNGAMPYTSPVGYFAANGYGLYDMAGNVFQWCWDWYGSYDGGRDPHGAVSGGKRILRGGYWFNTAFDSRCAYRSSAYPSLADYNFGFRCVRGP